MPVAAPLIMAMTPLAEIAAEAIGRLARRRKEHATEAPGDAVEASPDSPEDFIARATADDRRIELTTRTPLIAMDTALRDKRRALGRALAAGVAGDDARIDEELLFIRAVADLDTPHVKLLARMAEGPPVSQKFPLGYWDAATVQAQIPELGASWRPLLAVLELHGLIQPLQSSTPSQGSRVAYSATGLGEQVLSRLVTSR
jgi:hypothetical protein